MAAGHADWPPCRDCGEPSKIRCTVKSVSGKLLRCYYLCLDCYGGQRPHGKA